MPSESVGTCGHAQWPDRHSIDCELEFGIACLRRHCGPEPPGTSLEIVWSDHDSGAYATIDLVWEHGSLSGEHWKYIERCSRTLQALDDCVDWASLSSVRETSPESIHSPGWSKIGGPFAGFCVGLWSMLIIEHPRLWWFPLLLICPVVGWLAWDSWQETKSLMTPAEYRDWLVEHRRPQRWRAHRLHAWWLHFTRRP